MGRTAIAITTASTSGCTRNRNVLCLATGRSAQKPRFWSPISEYDILVNKRDTKMFHFNMVRRIMFACCKKFHRLSRTEIAPGYQKVREHLSTRSYQLTYAKVTRFYQWVEASDKILNDIKTRGKERHFLVLI